MSRTKGCRHRQFLRGYFIKCSMTVNTLLFIILRNELHEKYDCNDLPINSSTIFFQIKVWNLCYIFFYGDIESLKYNSSLINNFLASISD